MKITKPGAGTNVEGHKELNQNIRERINLENINPCLEKGNYIH